ncbi:MAG: hypothetical protein GY953_32825 [bacterium]|nr:hypothetical protein [bacterium]
MEYYTVAIKFDTLEFDNKRAALSVELETVGSPISVGGRPSLEVNFPGATIIDTPQLDGKPNVGVFYVKSGKLRLPKGFWMTWRTTSQR